MSRDKAAHDQPGACLEATTRRVPSGRVVVASIAIWICWCCSFGAEQKEYEVGPDDVLTVVVWGRPELSGKFNVEADGTVKLPLIERVTVSGLTSRRIEEEIRNRLVAGFLKNPQVSVTIEQYKSQLVSVQGEVRQPGSYPLKGETTLLEVLILAGPVTAEAGNELILVRRPTRRPTDGPVGSKPEDVAEVERIDLADLQSASFSKNLVLRDGDTIIVPRGEKVYIIGHVGVPGAYSIRKNTTVLQALALAGGVTDRGAANRIKIRRLVDGKQKEIGVKTDYLVQPGDTIVVPERFF